MWAHRYFPARYKAPRYWTPPVNVDLALTGVAGTGAAGSLTPSVTVALTGVEATGAAGSVGIGGLTVGLTGVAGTGAAGTLGPSTSVALTGVAGTGAAGSVTSSRTVPLTGVAGTGAVGVLGPFAVNTGGTRRVAIRRLRQGPTMGADIGQYLRFDRFTLDLETGPPRS